MSTKKQLKLLAQEMLKQTLDAKGISIAKIVKVTKWQNYRAVLVEQSDGILAGLRELGHGVIKSSNDKMYGYKAFPKRIEWSKCHYARCGDSILLSDMHQIMNFIMEAYNKS